MILINTGIVSSAVKFMQCEIFRELSVGDNWSTYEDIFV